MRTSHGGTSRATFRERVEQRVDISFLVLVVLIPVGILVFGISLFIYRANTRLDTTDPGDCAKLTSTVYAEAELRQAECTDPDAVYVVSIKSEDPVCDPLERQFRSTPTENRRARPIGCLRPNIAVGDCYDWGDDLRSPSKPACSEADPATASRLIALVEGTTDPFRCPEVITTGYYALETRSLLYCFAAPR